MHTKDLDRQFFPITASTINIRERGTGDGDGWDVVPAVERAGGRENTGAQAHALQYTNIMGICR
jgi:hypothetical protein